jgi:hypothetical protein
LVVAQAYLLTTRPEPGDPREDMHRAAIRSLRIVESKIREKGPETKSTSYKEKEKFRYNFTDNECSELSEEEKRHKRKEDARSIIAQALVNKSCHAWREENYEDDNKDMGALCFTRRVRKTWVPKGFKLPHDQKNMTDHKNLPYGYQITCRQYRYKEGQKRLQCKVCSYTSPAQHGPG